MRFKSNHEELFPKIGFLSSQKISELEAILGVHIRTTELFEQALMHRSYVSAVHFDFLKSNERLEFLGDAVLDLVVAEHLFFSNTDVLEGELTKLRSRLVNRKSLSLCAKHLKLDSFIMVSYSAMKTIESGNESILADTLEALIAAIYLDSGLSTAKNFVVNSLLAILQENSALEDHNFKSILLENVQGQGKSFPKYVVMSESGPDHEKEFLVGVFVDDTLLATGKGKSKKEAEQVAAQNALNTN